MRMPKWARDQENEKEAARQAALNLAIFATPSSSEPD